MPLHASEILQHIKSMNQRLLSGIIIFKFVKHHGMGPVLSGIGGGSPVQLIVIPTNYLDKTSSQGTGQSLNAYAPLINLTKSTEEKLTKKVGAGGGLTEVTTDTTDRN